MKTNISALVPTVFLAFGVASSASSLASTVPPSAVVKVRAAMKSRVGISTQAADVRLSVTVSKEGTCGSLGDSVIAEFQVKHFVRSMDRNGRMVLKPSYETVKTYGIPLADAQALTIEELKTGIMDAETCLE